jgi:probable phosphoglycerate mutase
MAASRPFDVLASSPRLRVRQSAWIVADALDLPVTVVGGLAGQEFGTADGRAWAGVTAGFGGEPAHDPDRPIAAGAEPWNAYADRVLAALTGILTAHAGGRVCVVGHGKTAGLAAALLSGAPDPRAAAPALVIAHGELSVWRRDVTGWHHEAAGRTAATSRR